MKHKQSIIIPAYKPVHVTVELVDALRDNFENIVVIDDGGGADFAGIFDEVRGLGATVLTHAINQGKGRALKTAINYCLNHPELSCHGVITVDGDGQHRPADIVRVAEAMEANPDDVVLGCRDFNTGNVPFKSYWGNNISKVVYKWLAGINVSDTQTGLRGLPYSIMPSLCTCDGERYEYETNMFLVMKEMNYGITEVLIETVYEDNNSCSHFNPVKDSIRIYSVILKYSVSSLVSSLIDYIVFIIANTVIFSVSADFTARILLATYIARAISCLFNFGINKSLVFKGKGDTKVQFFKYIILVIISGTISGTAVSYISSLAPHINPVIFKVPVEIVLYFFNYVIQRAFIFKPRGKE